MITQPKIAATRVTTHKLRWGFPEGGMERAQQPGRDNAPIKIALPLASAIKIAKKTLEGQNMGRETKLIIVGWFP